MPKIPKMVSSNQLQRGYIGIDPGNSGGIAVCLSNGAIEAWPMPENDRQIRQTIEIIERRCIVVSALIEKVGTMPKQGIVSAFTFGRNVGLLEMALISSNIPYEEVRPQIWQKAFTISSRKKQGGAREFKAHLLSIVQKLYPSFGLWSERNVKGKQLAVADAILIATYLQRRDQSL